MTLLDRLNPEYELNSDKYPNTYDVVIESLKRNHFYTELKVCEVIALYQILDLDLNISNLNKLFIS
jgi:hypothetical protein